MIRTLLALAALATPMLAQIPYGHLVIVNRTGSATVPGMQLLDPFTGTVTPLYAPGLSLAVGGGRTVAYDPAAPDRLYSTSLLSVSIAATVAVLQLTGNEFARSTQNINLGSPGLPFHLRWAPGFGLLLLGRGGQINRMFWRDSGNVVHQQPTPALLPNNASDMAFANGKAYASSEGDGTTVTNGTIIEWDLTANTDRIVGNAYPPICSLAVFGGQLLAGDDVGNLWLIDPTSGVANPFLATGLGRINSLAVDPLGIVYFVSTSGSTGAVYSMLDLINPLFSTTVSVIEDLEVGVSPVPTLLTYGSGCPGSNSATPSFVQGSMPGLGAAFTVQVRNALPASAGFLVLGSSRLADLLGQLPRALDGIGMPGCTQYTDVLTLLFAATSATGDASVVLNVPNNPNLAGLKLPMQWVIADAQANAVGASTSNGAEAFPR